MPPLFQQQTSSSEALEVFYREEDQDGEVTEHRQAVLNQPTALYCDTNAIPPPQLTWYKDGEPLSPGQGVRMLLGNRHGPTLWGLEGAPAEALQVESIHSMEEVGCCLWDMQGCRRDPLTAALWHRGPGAGAAGSAGGGCGQVHVRGSQCSGTGPPAL